MLSYYNIIFDRPPPVKVGACQALYKLLPDANEGIVLPHIVGLFSSLTELLNQVIKNQLRFLFHSYNQSRKNHGAFFFPVWQASDETLHLVLDTMQAAVTAGKNTCVLILDKTMS